MSIVISFLERPALCHCIVIIQSLLATCLTYWETDRRSTVKASRVQLTMTCKVLQLMKEVSRRINKRKHENDPVFRKMHNTCKRLRYLCTEIFKMFSKREPPVDLHIFQMICSTIGPTKQHLVQTLSGLFGRGFGIVCQMT